MAKGFDKFINKPVKGAKIKEAIRQEKKAAVKERREAIEKHFEEKRQQKQAMLEARQQQGENYKKPVPHKQSKNKSEGPRARSGGSKVGKKWDKPAKPKTLAPENTPQPKGKKPENQKSFTPTDRKHATPKAYGTNAKPVQRPSAQKPPVTIEKKNSNKPEGAKPAFNKPTGDKSTFNKTIKPAYTKPADKPAVSSKTGDKSLPYKAAKPNTTNATPADRSKATTSNVAPAKSKEATDTMPLNKFLAHAGICSRRDAADKVRQGLASVNGEVITEPAFKVSDTDVVKFDGKKVQRSNNLVYILLNKPKDTITTADDPQGRKTVMDIIRPATQERVYPVGRLDRNTSGVLLLTNDGDLAQQLSHPSFEVRKIYEVRLDKALTKTDFDKILDGLTLEDGKIHADSLAYSDPKDKTMVGIEIHSGRNRIVRRMFEHLGYDVRGLDRVMYANLTKKNVERGHWRFLSEKEVRLLKYFNKSKKKQPTVDNG
jgi:23S rRNA pseudouridine2605 synthase